LEKVFATKNAKNTKEKRAVARRGSWQGAVRRKISHRGHKDHKEKKRKVDRHMGEDQNTSRRWIFENV
jgi:hypothetical protein